MQFKNNPDWIRFTFSNAESFVGTIPAYCSIDEQEIIGKNWARIFVAIVEHEINASNPALDVLYDNPLPPSKSECSFFMKEKEERRLNYAKLSNDYWINVNFSIPTLMKNILKFCRYCGYTDEQIVIYGIVKNNSTVNHNRVSYTEETHDKQNDELREKLEWAVFAAELDGITAAELAEGSSLPLLRIQKTVQSSTKIVSIDNRLYHEDVFTDWEKGANQLEAILEKIMNKNNGYISYTQLYEYARTEMELFLSDNDMDSPAKVFDMAEHLFDKEGYHGKHYHFYRKTHISKVDNKITSKMDIIKKYARDSGGFFRQEDLENHLQKLGVDASSLRQQMRIYEEPTFLMYAPSVFITEECIDINEEWLAKVNDALKRLFADVGDHVVFRDIVPHWYSLLPKLPNEREWTPLLLQNVLMHYGEKIKARIIRGLPTQAMETLGAMLVSAESELTTFADAVMAFLLDSGIEARRFAAEELRQLLVENKLIAGNELIWNMPKALPNDEHFAWDSDRENATIRL